MLGKQGMFGALGGYRQFKQTIQIVLRGNRGCLEKERRTPEVRGMAGSQVVAFWAKGLISWMPPR
jgi:hypothetical protein